MAGVFLASVFLFSTLFTQAAEEAQIQAAIEDLSSAVGQDIKSEEQAKELCNQEQYLDICADIGKKHGLYTEVEVAQVDAFLNEVKGQVLEDIKACQDESCLIKVANLLAQKVKVNNPTLATNFKLTSTIIEQKNSVIQAAKEVGVNFRDCEAMNPDTAPVDLLRKCAKLAKDSRVQKYIPEEKRLLAAEFEDSATIKLREALSAGKYQCGDGTLEGCGNFCLNPIQGTSIPPVCSQIASEIFGSEGVKQLEAAHQQVGQVKDYYSKKFILVLPDGSEIVGERQIRNRCDQAFSNRNLEVARACGSFAVSNGFVSQAEVDKGLKLMESFTQKSQNVNFEQCLSNPASCRDFLPEDEIGSFDAGNQIFEIMKTEIGFDPQQCERGAVDESIGKKCFEGSKRALAKMESLGLAGQSREARFIIEDIKRHVSEGENLIKRKDEFREVFNQQGGPGGCRSEGECYSYCSNPTNGPECISFGAKQNISGFRGQEAVQKLQEYNQNLQRPGLTSDSQYPQFPGQGPYPGFQPGYVPPGQVPGFTQPGPGFNPPPGTGPIGPSPECFAAIQSGDFIKAKAVCTSPNISDDHTSTCQARPYIECPAGQYHAESFRNEDGCWIDGPCTIPSYSPGLYPTYSPYPTGSQGPYPTYSPGTNSGWINKTWSFKDGSTQHSSILNRIDSEYAGHINRVYNDCLNKYFAGWKPGGGDQNNWQEFGIPVCSDTASTTVSPFPTYSPYPTGSTYPTYSPGPGSGGCPSGYHYHGESGGFCMNDQENYGGTCYDSVGTSRITCPTQPTYSPYPSSSSCPSGQWWDSVTSSCRSNTSYGGCTGTSQSSCTSVANCYWNSADNYCFYQSTSYTPSPTCSSTQYWNGSSCVDNSTTSTYTPYPTSTYTTTYTPPPSCSSDQYWDGSACVANPTPYPTADPATACANSGGTWDGSTCLYTTPPPTSGLFPSYIVTHCQQLGRSWNGKICEANGLFARFYENSGLASILRLFYMVH
ncbi:MAG: hypothetical protein HYT61_01060 [Candidatus Yanofskybacteria bacterium]|nr:hypothetical protein [Candidatus Yanofskybacteria bacterium]